VEDPTNILERIRFLVETNGVVVWDYVSHNLSDPLNVEDVVVVPKESF
jgi:hypothetical protein